MQISNPRDIIGKEVFDDQGAAVGTLDKYWRSWNKQDIGWFFGIRPYENVRDKWLRGTTKLFPINSSYIAKIGDTITLKKGMQDLSQEWKQMVCFKQTSWPTDYLMEMGVYDKCGSRVGNFLTWVKFNGKYEYGCLIDPYLSEKWHYDYKLILPLKVEFLNYIRDSIRLTASLDDLKNYWDNHTSEKSKTKTVKHVKRKVSKRKTSQKRQKPKVSKAEIKYKIIK